MQHVGFKHWAPNCLYTPLRYSYLTENNLNLIKIAAIFLYKKEELKCDGKTHWYSTNGGITQFEGTVSPKLLDNGDKWIGE